MLVFSHNRYTILFLALFLFLPLIFPAGNAIHAQQRPSIERKMALELPGHSSVNSPTADRNIPPTGSGLNICERTDSGRGVIPSEVEVRILSIKHIREISLVSPNISITSRGKKLTGNSFTIGMIANSSNLIVDNHSGKISLVSPVSIKSHNPVFLKIKGLQARSYFTPLYVRSTGKQLIVTCRLPLEEYAAGVIRGEMPEGRGDALLAQAVVARSYAIKNIQKHKNEGYDFCDCTHCQVYRGAVSSDSPFHSAALATRGLVLMYNGIPVEGLYHSTCGGYTCNPEDVYGAEEPGITGIKDSTGGEKKSLCAHSPHFKWKYKIKGKELQKVLCKESAYSSLRNIENVKIEKKDYSGRVLMLAIEEKERRFLISGYDFWQIMGSRVGWGKFKSSLFTVQKEGENYIFDGRGLGHGLGMCQWGAMRMAEKGYDFKEILKHYFPEAEVGRRRQ